MMMKKFMSKLSDAVLLIACLMLLTTVLAAASDGMPDLGKNGSCSIHVTLREKASGNPIGGGTLELIKVAGITADRPGEFTPELSFIGAKLDLSGDADLSAPSLASSIALYADNEGVSGTRQNVDSSGNVDFTGLDLGVYLVVDRVPAEGYNTIKPFLVTVPMKENGSYVYNVDASPKPERLTGISPVTSACPVISKALDVPGGEANATEIQKYYMKISPFEFRFTRLDQDSPMPVNTTGSSSSGGAVVSQTNDALVVTREGPGSLDIGTIAFSAPGEYYYQVSEIKGSGNYIYDTNSFVVRYLVEREGDALVVKNVSIHAGDANGELVSGMTVSYTNSYRKELVENEEEVVEAYKTRLHLNEEDDGGKTGKTTIDITPTEDKKKTKKTNGGEEEVTKTPSRSGNTTSTSGNTARVTLPQTGQLWWPVWILAGAGVVLLVIGLIRRKTSH